MRWPWSWKKPSPPEAPEHDPIGVPVRLGDMAFPRLLFEPASPPSLRLRFVYDDPEWTPEQAAATPVAVPAFGDAVVLSSEDDRHEPDYPAGFRGEVWSFDYH